MSARGAGLIAAVALGLLLLVTVVLSVGPEEVVVPTNGVTAGGAHDNPGGLAAGPALASRAYLQKWASTGKDEPTMALGPSDKSGEGAPGEQAAPKAGQPADVDLLQKPQFRQGVSPLPSPESSVLVQPQGRTWRNWHNDQVAYGGALYVLGVSLLIAGFLAWRGRIPMKEGESGQSIERFTAFERANHWMTAVSFLLMALTGLVILYGNGLIRPWLGAGAYASLAEASAWSHMTLAVPFVIGVLVMIVMWTRQNLPERLDWTWLKRGGGFVSDTQESPPARKFNAGQKLVFWGVALGGLFLTATGVMLMFPFFWTGYAGMQMAQTLHAAAGLLMIGLIIGHIYIGTIGMRGAFDAMWSGRVDRNWAKEHHSLWYGSLDQPSPAQDRDRRPAPAARAGVGAFASGAVIALAAAFVMAGIYQIATISGTERTTSSGPTSVHVDSSDSAYRPFAARKP